MEVGITEIGSETFSVDGRDFTVEIIDSIFDYLELMKSIFDFDKLKKLIAEGIVVARRSEGKNGKPFKLLINSMNGG